MDFDATDALFWFAMGMLASWVISGLTVLILYAHAPRFEVRETPGEGE